MSNAPVTQQQIDAISTRAEGPTHLMYSDDCLTLRRAIAERDATIAAGNGLSPQQAIEMAELKLQLRDTREDLANYRASAEEQIEHLSKNLKCAQEAFVNKCAQIYIAEEQLRLHKEALRWIANCGAINMVGGGEYFYGNTAAGNVPADIRETLMAAVSSKP